MIAKKQIKISVDENTAFYLRMLLKKKESKFFAIRMVKGSFKKRFFSNING
jgi:hypothetical protein